MPTSFQDSWPLKNARLAVLASGGLDSAILVGEALARGLEVQPLYMRQGLSWESVELSCLGKFLKEAACSRLRPLTVLNCPVDDVYPEHWSLTGENVPGADSPDEAVYLPGRNVLLLSKGMLYCHLHDIGSLALATLKGNPFPDATPEFFVKFESVVNQAISGVVRLVRPYAGLTKKEVMEKGRSLPLEFTFSCIRPQKGLHCGVCNKCAERQRGFREAHISDATHYSMEKSCIK